jgi:hypothetical protein
MARVESSAVEAIDYKERPRRLIVTYAGGATYAYAGVPRHTWDALRAAESKGRLVNLEIKPRFPVTRL